jgi:hypothetical protein
LTRPIFPMGKLTQFSGTPIPLLVDLGHRSHLPIESGRRPFFTCDVLIDFIAAVPGFG